MTVFDLFPRLLNGRTGAIAIAAVISLAAIGIEAAPITFNTALPVGKGEFVLREQVIVSQSGDDPGGTNRDATGRALVSVVGYGLSGRLAVFGALPVVDKELDVTTAGVRASRNASGLGDLSLLARYTVFKRDGPGRTFRIAPFAGTTLPTGEDDETDTMGRLPASVQPGSGAWDGFGGIVMTYQTLDYQMDGQLSYRANGEANGIDRGDTVRADASLQYRLWPRNLSAGVPGFLYGVLEVGVIRRGKNRVGTNDDPDSGGLSVVVTPGIQYVTRRWIVEAGVELPLVQDLNGAALEMDYVVRAGFRVNF